MTERAAELVCDELLTFAERTYGRKRFVRPTYWRIVGAWICHTFLAEFYAETVRGIVTKP